jgi:hypothetical protein
MKGKGSWGIERGRSADIARGYLRLTRVIKGDKSIVLNQSVRRRARKNIGVRPSFLTI